MSLLKPGLKCLTAPVGMNCLLWRVMVSVRCLVAVSMHVKESRRNPARSCSILSVKEVQSALL